LTLTASNFPQEEFNKLKFIQAWHAHLVVMTQRSQMKWSKKPIWNSKRAEWARRRTTKSLT
jgi:hypothetical protein